MKPEPDETAFEWIRSGRRARVKRDSPEWKGYVVSHLIPPAFGAYAKVLHPIGASYEFVDHPLSPAENEILNIPSCEPLRSFVINRRANPAGERIKWKELADLLGVPFAPAICHEWYRKKMEDPWCWPRLLSGPGEGSLRAEDCKELASVLEAFTEGQDCFFRYSDIPFYASRNDGKPKLWRAALSQIMNLPNTGGYLVGPEYWWPTEKNWCICSEYDLSFTVVAGPGNLIARLLASQVLECIEVTPDTRIDSLAPMP
jgi:hypothetical protein